MHKGRVLRGKKKGVSDVVANILILAITVTLFSTVFFFVGQLPSPSGQVYVDIQPAFEVAGVDATGKVYTYTLKLEHRGGQTVVDWLTEISIVISGKNSTGVQKEFSKQLTLGNSTVKIGDRFEMGKTWVYSFKSTTTPKTTVVSIFMVDSQKGSVFWERTLPVSIMGGPYIVDKGILTSDIAGNWNPAPYIGNDENFKVYLGVFDPQNKVSKITADMTPIGGSSAVQLFYSIFGDRYQTSLVMQVSGFTSPAFRDITVTVSDKTGINQTTTVRISILAGTAPVGNDYVDLGQICTITPSASVGREIVISNDQPMTGEKVLITAPIRNIGNLAAKNATVEFKDGTELIGTVVMSVPALGKVDAVVQWAFKTPGKHIIWVNVTNVDPPDKNPDITVGVTPGFRNLYVQKEVRVFVYFDDMEGSLDKWRHESTLVRINAEGPLDYDNYSTSIDITANWDPAMSNIGPGNWTKTNVDYRSYPYCYGMTEYAMNPGKSIDVCLVLDNSGSMAGVRWTNLVTAATTFVGSLGRDDRCAIYTFQGGGSAPDPIMAAPFTVTDLAGRTALNATISGLSPFQATPLWDTIGAATQYVQTNYNHSKLPVVIAMTDGVDDVTIASTDDETASNVFCPGSPVGGTGRTWATTPASDGCIWGSPARNYVGIQRCRNGVSLDTFTWINTMRTGLINSPILTYTVGLMPSPQASNASNPGYMPITNPNYKYTTEYDLRQIAETTKGDTLTGQYFYGGNPSDLVRIYKTIAGLLNNWSNSQKNIQDPYHSEYSDIDTEVASGSGDGTPLATIYQQNFDATDGTWTSVSTVGVPPNGGGAVTPDTWQWGTPTNGPFNDHTTGTGKCWDVVLGANYGNFGGQYSIACRSPVISLTGYSGVVLSFWMWSDVEGSFNNYDGMNIKANSGSGWAVVSSPTPAYDGGVGSGNPLVGQAGWTYDHASWTQITVSLASYSGAANFQLEFDFGTDPGVGGPGVAIDDVLITGTLGVNNPPNTPSMPSGPTSGTTGTSYSYSTTATDPNGDQIKYTFDWGDGTPQSSTGYVASGSSSSLGHTFSTAGTYLVRAMATDISGATSGWSVTLSVTITGSSSGGGGSTGPRYYGNKSLVTNTFVLGSNTYYTSAKLSFDHKFNLHPGSNGGAVFVGLNIGGSWKWRYVKPQPTYTGNLNVTSTYYDDNHLFPKQTTDQRLFYVYNGISGGGAFTWERAEVDLTPYIPGNAMNSPGAPLLGSQVRVKFGYLYCGGGNNGGWWIDNVEVKVTRNESANITSNTKDLWKAVTGSVAAGTTHNGTRCWFNKMEDQNGFKMSVDNSLITAINLVNVKNASLQFYTKFNINTKDGLPPMGFRVEVSNDNGFNWRQINNGVRSGYGVSGTLPYSDDMGDGIADGRSWGGIHQAGDPSVTSWIPATSLTRVNCDLSKWSGTVILLRFRVITNNIGSFNTYELGAQPHGIYIDDVMVIGNITKSYSHEPGVCNQLELDSVGPLLAHASECIDDYLALSNSDARNCLTILQVSAPCTIASSCNNRDD